MLDLTDRIIQPKPVQTPTLMRAANGNLKWHVPRRLLQVLCGVGLVVLPFTNGLRLDLRRDEFYFAWHKMAGHDLFLLLWVALLGTALLSAVSFLYGRPLVRLGLSADAGLRLCRLAESSPGQSVSHPPRQAALSAVALSYGRWAFWRSRWEQVSRWLPTGWPQARCWRRLPRPGTIIQRG